MALTRRQRQIYDFVCEFVREHGYSPSLEEIGEAFGLSSVATVHKHVHHLVEKGFLRKAWNRSRSVEPVPEEPDPSAGMAVTLPLLGAVADGIILVVRLGSTPRSYVERTFGLLESLGGNVLGTCLTGAHLVAAGK